MPHGPARILELPWRERWWFACALVLLPLTALVLKLVPIGRITALVDAKGGSVPQDDSPAVDRIAHMVAAAAEFGPYRATCLPQSLVLQTMLRRAGVRTELRYGVRRPGGQLAAHCWVECDGRPLIDSVAVRRHFEVLEPTPRRGRGAR